MAVLLNTGSGIAALWTAWLWAWTFAFAVLTAVGLLYLGTMLYLKLYDDGALAWSFLTVGSAFLTCFLFGRGVNSCSPDRQPLCFTSWKSWRCWRRSGRFHT